MNFFNPSTGIFMDTKVVFQTTDQGLFAVEVDTNRVTTPYGQDRSSSDIMSGIGFLFNLGNMVVTFMLIKGERLNKRIVKNAKNKKKNQDDKDDAKTEKSQKDGDA